MSPEEKWNQEHEGLIRAKEAKLNELHAVQKLVNDQEQYLGRLKLLGLIKCTIFLVISFAIIGGSLGMGFRVYNWAKGDVNEAQNCK